MFYYLLPGLLLLALTINQERRTHELFTNDRFENAAVSLAIVLAWPPLVAMVLRDYVRERRKAAR